MVSAFPALNLPAEHQRRSTPSFTNQAVVNETDENPAAALAQVIGTFRRRCLQVHAEKQARQDLGLIDGRHETRRGQALPGWAGLAQRMKI